MLTKNYFAVRRHQDVHGDLAALRAKTPNDSAKYAVLLDEPVRFDVEAQLAELLNARMKMEASEAEQKRIDNVSPRLKVQSFQVADGSLRYYVQTTSASRYLLAA